MTKLDSLIEDLQAANARLMEALALASTPINKDGTIQRFEFTFELAWKAMQAYLRDQGLDAASPKRSIREAARLGLIAKPEEWLDFLEHRNNIAHSYNEAMADEIYAALHPLPALVDSLVAQLTTPS
jgi:nucleotidyltransferase substrate binding protein (TIGR01987 family)